MQVYSSVFKRFLTVLTEKRLHPAFNQVHAKSPEALILLAFMAQKNTVPAAIALSAKTVLSVRLQGFEPWTP